MKIEYDNLGNVKTIGGTLIQDDFPTPDKPISIKTLKVEDINQEMIDFFCKSNTPSVEVKTLTKEEIMDLIKKGSEINETN